MRQLISIKTCSICGWESQRLWRSNPPVCAKNSCKQADLRNRGKGKIKQVSDKQKGKIAENNKYYRWAIAANIAKNKGTCRCDNCDKEIKNASGKNVSHIISAGANEKLYHEKANHFIFGSELKYDACRCEQLFSEEGKRSEMRIYPEFLRRHENLNLKYYDRNS